MPEIQFVYPIQAWPTLINARRCKLIAPATAGVFRLIMSIPERILDGNPERFASYVSMPAARTKYLLSHPDGLDYAIGRGNFIDSDEEIKCIEFNRFGSLGGLETESFAQAFRKSTAFPRSIEDTGAEIKLDRVVLALFEYFLHEALVLGIDGDEINIAAIVDDDVHFESDTAKYAPNFAEALQRVDPALHGHILGCRTDEIGNRFGALFLRGLRLHATRELGIDLNDRCPEHF